MGNGKQNVDSAPDVRLLILSTGDPNGERAFSGAVRSLSNALEARGALHFKANVNGYTDPFRKAPLGLHLVKKVDSFRLLEKYRWSGASAYRRTQRALRVAKAHPGFNACLMCGTQFEPHLGVPTYCYFDETVVQVAESGEWGFRYFSQEKVKGLIEAQQRVFDLCAGIFPWARWSADSVLNDYGVSPEKVCIAGAGPNYMVEPLPHGPYDNKTILFVGRDFERKGGGVIVEALRLVRRKIPDAKLVLIGTRLPIDEPGVEVMGEISKNEPGGLDRILKHYSEASVFCMMSKFEPFGIVVVEAQNCFVPCIVPKRFAFTETVVDGVTGRHVNGYEPEDLARTLVEMLSDPARLVDMGQAGHEHVRSNYTWDLVADRVLERIRADLAKAEDAS